MMPYSLFFYEVRYVHIPRIEYTDSFYMVGWILCLRNDFVTNL